MTIRRKIFVIIYATLKNKNFYNNIKQTYKCYILITHLTTYWVNIRGILHPTLIGRVNKLMTNNIRSTYNCHTFLESSGQVHQTIYRVNIWGSLTLYPNIGLIWCRVKKLIFSIKRLICLTSASRFCFIKSQS